MGDWTVDGNLSVNTGLYLNSAIIPATPSDGQASDIYNYSVIPVPTWNYNQLNVSSSDTAAYFEAWLKRVCVMYPDRNRCLFIGTVLPNSTGSVVCSIYSTAALTNGLPQYASGTYTTVNGDVGARAAIFGTYQYEFVYSSNLITAYTFIDTKESASVTIAANNHTTLNVTIGKTGCTPIGIVGITWTGSSWPVLGGFCITSSTNAALYLINPTSSAMTVTKYILKVLYLRS